MADYKDLIGEHRYTILTFVDTCTYIPLRVEDVEAWPTLPSGLEDLTKIFEGTTPHPAILTYPESVRLLSQYGINLQDAWFAVGGVLGPWACLLEVQSWMQEATKTVNPVIVNLIINSAKRDAYYGFHPEDFQQVARALLDMVKNTDLAGLLVAAGIAPHVAQAQKEKYQEKEEYLAKELRSAVPVRDIAHDLYVARGELEEKENKDTEGDVVDNQKAPVEDSQENAWQTP